MKSPLTTAQAMAPREEYSILALRCYIPASSGELMRHYQFIVQELAPSRLGWGLLALLRACLSALLYKSIYYRFERANVTRKI